MLDFEMSVSCVCWMQDSCSGFFSDTIESLDPIEIGCKMDPKGEYIKKYLPQLKNIPTKYIHAPWLAPSEVQKEAEFVIGKDYPKPINDMCTQGKLCCAWIEAIMNALEDTYSDWCVIYVVEQKLYLVMFSLILPFIFVNMLITPSLQCIILWWI